MIPFDAPAFVPLKGRKITARVNKVYDGDTITVVLATAEQHFKYRVRLVGIDTPELKIAEQKERGLAARAHLLEAITGGRDLEESECLVDLECEGADKYGRILARVYKDGKDLSQMMLDDGFANPYDGGTKLEFSV